jgi:hypothetical protein
LAIAVSAFAIGVARWVMRREVGFGLDNDAGHDAVVMLADYRSSENELEIQDWLL